MEKKPTGQLMSARELEETLGLTRNGAYTLLHTTGFPTVKIGSRLYAVRSEVDRWLKQESEKGGYRYGQKERQW